MNNEGRLIAFFIQFLIFVPWGCYLVNKKNRGWGYYVLLILWPLIGFITALCLSKKEKETPPSNDITNVQQ